jgi:hypothetical protein
LNAAFDDDDSIGDLPLKNPISGLPDCCAYATKGHAAEVHKPAMNSRRFTEVPPKV